ncbi:MAG TPA: HAMP domain-containing protein, partial [Telluria sp.]|nr:HAMP domain-containing protein [Telluria sp.]
MASTTYQRLRARLSKLYGLSIYGALLLVVFGGLVMPALVGGYLLIGVQERASAHAALHESLQRNADILALGMQESLWNMNAESARSLLDSVMRDPSVLQIQVHGQSDTQFMNVHSANRPIGTVYRAERDILVRGERIGRIVVEMDDARSQQELRGKQANYALVLAGQLAISLALIVLFLNKRLLSPLRKLMTFSDRLSRGDFETRLDLAGNDELG